MTKSELKALINECIEESIKERSDDIVDEGCIAIYEEMIDDDLLNEAEGSTDRKSIMKATLRVLKDIFAENGERDIAITCVGLSKSNRSFKKGEGDIIKIQISSKTASRAAMAGALSDNYDTKDARNANKDTNDAIRAAAKIVNEKQAQIKKAIKDETGVTVEYLKVSAGKLGATDIAVKYKF